MPNPPRADEGRATSAEAPTASKSPGPLGRLAVTMRRRTLDLVAIAILVVAGLTFGSRIAHWWDRDAEPVLATGSEDPTLTWNEPGEPIEIVLGDSDFVLQREILEGETEVVVEQLLDQTLSLAESAPSPEVPPDEAERHLAESAGRLEPSRKSDDGQVSVHLSMLPLPTAIGLRRESGSEGDDAPARAVCWGVLLGGADGTWTAYWSQRRSATEERASDSTIELPRDATTTLRVLDSKGTGLLGIRGPGTAEQWRNHFDSRFDGEAVRSTGWAESSGNWTAAFDVIDAADGPRTISITIVAREDHCEALIEIRELVTNRSGETP